MQDLKKTAKKTKGKPAAKPKRKPRAKKVEAKEEVGIELPLAFVLGFEVIMDADYQEDTGFTDAIKSAFIAALGDIQNRYKDKTLHMTLVHKFQTPDMELF